MDEGAVRKGGSGGQGEEGGGVAGAAMRRGGGPWAGVRGKELEQGGVGALAEEAQAPLAVPDHEAHPLPHRRELVHREHGGPTPPRVPRGNPDPPPSLNLKPHSERRVVCPPPMDPGGGGSWRLGGFQ